MLANAVVLPSAFAQAAVLYETTEHNEHSSSSSFAMAADDDTNLKHSPAAAGSFFEPFLLKSARGNENNSPGGITGDREKSSATSGSGSPSTRFESNERHSSNAYHEHERRALFAIFKGLGGTPHLQTAGKWLNATTNHCEWTGVTCQTIHLDQMNHCGVETSISSSSSSSAEPVPVVTRLELPYSHLTGTLPVQLIELQYLTILHLSNNHLVGSIPAELVQLSHLQVVYLQQQQQGLTGPIPYLHSVRELVLSSNQLTGSLQFTSESLQLLDLSDNLLTGTLPERLNLLTALNFLVLSQNALTGTLPDLRGMSHLRLLDVSDNALTGTVNELLPSSLWHLLIADNSLQGPFPQTVLSTLPDLHAMVLSNNQFTGRLPQESHDWDTYQQLIVLLLDRNQFTGTLPVALYKAQASSLAMYVKTYHG